MKCFGCCRGASVLRAYSGGKSKNIQSFWRKQNQEKESSLMGLVPIISLMGSSCLFFLNTSYVSMVFLFMKNTSGSFIFWQCKLDNLRIQLICCFFNVRQIEWWRSPMPISLFPKSCCLTLPEVLIYRGTKKKDESLAAIQKGL